MPVTAESVERWYQEAAGAGAVSVVPVSGVDASGSARLVAARLTAVAVIATISSEPATVRRRNPIAVVRAVLVVVSWVLVVSVAVFAPAAHPLEFVSAAAVRAAVLAGAGPAVMSRQASAMTTFMVVCGPFRLGSGLAT